MADQQFHFEDINNHPNYLTNLTIPPVDGHQTFYASHGYFDSGDGINTTQLHRVSPNAFPQHEDGQTPSDYTVLNISGPPETAINNYEQPINVVTAKNDDTPELRQLLTVDNVNKVAEMSKRRNEPAGAYAYATYFNQEPDLSPIFSDLAINRSIELRLTNVTDSVLCNKVWDNWHPNEKYNEIQFNNHQQRQCQCHKMFMKLKLLQQRFNENFDKRPITQKYPYATMLLRQRRSSVPKMVFPCTQSNTSVIDGAHGNQMTQNFPGYQLQPPPYAINYYDDAQLESQLQEAFRPGHN
ncbi:hypothetical protein CHUAL_010600 [Chamberlinius hualienensis]